MSILRVNKIAAPIIEEEYTGSVHLPGTGNRVVASGFDSNLTGAFTIEGWYLASTLNANSIFFGNYNESNEGIYLRYSSTDDEIYLFWRDADASSNIILRPSSVIINTNQWHHIAVTRDDSDTVRIFLDGRSLGSVNNTDSAETISMSVTNFAIGALNPSHPNFWDGYVSNFRIVNGTALYTDDFEVPTSELKPVDGTVLLCCQSSTSVTEEVSGGSTLTTTGSPVAVSDPNPGFFRKFNVYSTTTENTGSVFFDGDGDFLTTPHNADFNMHDSKYTWELWFYTTDIGSGEGSGGYGGLFSKCTASSSVTYGLGFDSSGNLFFKYWNGSATVTTQATTTIVTGKWYHVAVVKDTASATSGNTKIFLNGNLEATTAVSGTFYSESSNPLEIGRDSRSTTDYFQGYISNVRAVKGAALYTSNFTPPTAELELTPETVLVACHDGEDIFAEKTGKIIAAYGDRLSSPTPTATDSPIGITTFQPGLTRSVDPTAGPVLQGSSNFNSQNFLVLPKGTTTDRNRTGGRGIFGAGFDGSSNVNTINFVTISSTGNASDFGDLTQTRYGPGSCSSSTKGVFGGGYTPTLTNTIDYITIPSTGDAVDFGDLTVSRRSLAGASNSTRGLFAGGAAPANSNTIDFITIPTLGDAIDFGNLTSARSALSGCSSPTRGIFAGGAPSSDVIDFITIATTGDATDFGDLSTARTGLSAVSSNTRGVFAGGNPTSTNVIDFITISTLGDATDFGDLTLDRRQLSSSGASNSIRGVFAGGRQSPSPATNTNLMDYITIASTGDAKDFGDLIATTRLLTGCSDSHGGLS